MKTKYCIREKRKSYREKVMHYMSYNLSSRSVTLGNDIHVDIVTTLCLIYLMAENRLCLIKGYFCALEEAFKNKIYKF